MSWWTGAVVGVLVGVPIGDLVHAATLKAERRVCDTLTDIWWSRLHWRMKVTLNTTWEFPVLGSQLLHARMSARRWSYVQEALVLYCYHGTRMFAVRWEDEGKAWCRGWEGSQVDALKTVVTLSESTT